MEFFEKLKSETAKRLTDLSTVEHAFLTVDEERSDVLIYRRQELDGDSLMYLNESEVSEETIQTFNQAFEAAVVSRTGILSALIKILT